MQYLLRCQSPPPRLWICQDGATSAWPHGIFSSPAERLGLLSCLIICDIPISFLMANIHSNLMLIHFIQFNDSKWDVTSNNFTLIHPLIHLFIYRQNFNQIIKCLKTENVHSPLKHSVNRQIRLRQFWSIATYYNQS